MLTPSLLEQLVLTWLPCSVRPPFAALAFLDDVPRAVLASSHRGLAVALDEEKEVKRTAQMAPRDSPSALKKLQGLAHEQLLGPGNVHHLL